MPYLQTGLIAVALAMVGLTAYAHDAPAPKIVQPGTMATLPFPGHGMHTLAKGTDLPANISVKELVIPPKSIGAPPHLHANEDEIFVVLAGNVTFLNGEESVATGAGGAALLPRGHWHGVWNPNDEPAKLLLIIAPAAFETFFDEVVMNIRAQQPGSPQEVAAIIGQAAAALDVKVDPARFPPEALALLPK